VLLADYRIFNPIRRRRHRANSFSNMPFDTSVLTARYA
jgi:hypothetical protein